MKVMNRLYIERGCGMEPNETQLEGNQYGSNHDGMDQSQPQSNGKAQAIVALVAGIVGIVLSFVPFIGVGGSITGIVLGAIYRRRPQG